MFKTSEHPYVIRFTTETRVSDINKHEIPGKKLNFKPFAEIISGNWRSDLLVDVIGLVEEIGYRQMSVGNNKQQVNLILKDHVNDTLNYTFLGDICCEIHELRSNEQRRWSDNHIVTICES